MTRNGKGPRYGMYLAVLPAYRRSCIEILRAEIGTDLQIWASPAHLDPSVTTGIPKAWYSPTRMIRIAGRAFIQVGSFLTALRTRSLVVDLNPRSITAWALLVSRRVLGRQTSAWGHLHSQNGTEAPTAALRRMMRRLATNTVVYTYSSRDLALKEMVGRKVFVAANALYRREDIHPDSNIARLTILYVGRFVKAKKVRVLIEAFGLLADTIPSIKLVLVGGGEEEPILRALVHELGLTDNVEFRGWIEDLEELRTIYSRAFISVSPGFAGLQITQSMGFGVPILISKDEPHSPEVELAAADADPWFVSNSPEALADKLRQRFASRADVPLEHLSRKVRTEYSAETMAAGLRDALMDRS